MNSPRIGGCPRALLDEFLSVRTRTRTRTRTQTHTPWDVRSGVHRYGKHNKQQTNTAQNTYRYQAVQPPTGKGAKHKEVKSPGILSLHSWLQSMTTGTYVHFPQGLQASHQLPVEPLRPPQTQVRRRCDQSQCCPLLARSTDRVASINVRAGVRTHVHTV